MPYSAEKMLEHHAKKFVNKLLDIAYDAIDITTEQIAKDLSDTFDKCIDDFYSYETEYYYRHEIGKGTGTGWNLYLANEFGVAYSGSSTLGIYCGWEGEGNMSPYRDWRDRNGKDQPISVDHVLDSVMNGIRFNGDGTFPAMEWRLKNPIRTTYFGTIKASTPDQVFDVIMDSMYKVRRNLTYRNFMNLYRNKKK
jgi:hypothetical protein